MAARQPVLGRACQPVYSAPERPTEAFNTPTTVPRWWVKLRTLVASPTADMAAHHTVGLPAPALCTCRLARLMPAATPMSKKGPPLHATAAKSMICPNDAWIRPVSAAHSPR